MEHHDLLKVALYFSVTTAVCEVLGMEARAPCILGEYSTNRAILSPTQFFMWHYYLQMNAVHFLEHGPGMCVHVCLHV